MPLLTEGEFLIKKMQEVDKLSKDDMETPEGIDRILDWLYSLYHLPDATEQEKKETLHHMRGLYSLKSRLHLAA